MHPAPRFAHDDRVAEADAVLREGTPTRCQPNRGSDRIRGATLVAPHAGEMLNELTVAMTEGLGLCRLAGVIHPYPTQAEAIKRAADLCNRRRLTSFRKRLLSRLLAWRR